jgi:MFS family permease
MTAGCIPLVYLLVPETVHWLLDRQPADALRKVNATLRSMGHESVSALPVSRKTAGQSPVTGLFSPVLLATTVLVTLAYFFHITTFYFVIKWVPKIVVDLGFEPSSAVGVLVWANVGGALGGAVLGVLTLKYNVKALTMAVLLLSALMVTVFGRAGGDLVTLSIVCAVAGFFTNAGVVGMYALFAHSYPTRVRASGTGFSIGLGRGGAMLAPILAGLLFERGMLIPTVAVVLACGSLFAFVALLFLKMRPAENVMKPDDTRKAGINDVT